ncbi:MAG: hypothetical protein AMXMBFR34_42240 [Myxococcaceae bacterium]
METLPAPDTTWEVRVRWGNRRLEASVLDGRGRRTLALGDQKHDDVQLGHPGHVRFEWTEAGLVVRFTAGVMGTLRQRGDAPVSLSDLVRKGVVKEDGTSWVLRLQGTDALALTVGTLSIETRRGRGRFVRLPFDARVLVLVVLAVLAVALVIASVSQPPELPKLQWLKR